MRTLSRVILLCSIVYLSSGCNEANKDADKYLNKDANNDLNKDLTIDTKEWRLVFQDEFNVNSIDVTKWNVIDTDIVYNHELQYYTPDSIKIQNSNLTITSEQRNYVNRKFTSGKITTQDKFNFLYGRIDIRAKLPNSKGLSPAFWLLPSNGDVLPEIDMMETIGDNVVYNTYHWGLPNNIRHPSTYYSLKDFDTKFHTYELTWDASSIKWYIDGRETYEVHENVLDKSAYLIINTAVGGSWALNPSENFKSEQMIVDYVKIYKGK